MNAIGADPFRIPPLGHRPIYPRFKRIGLHIPLNTRLIPPRELAAVRSPRCLLPLRLSRKAFSNPTAVVVCIKPGNTAHRMIILRLRIHIKPRFYTPYPRYLPVSRQHKLPEFPNTNLIPVYVKPLKPNPVLRDFIHSHSHTNPSILLFASHQKPSLRDIDHPIR